MSLEFRHLTDIPRPPSEFREILLRVPVNPPAMFTSRIAFDGSSSDESNSADASNDTVVTRNRSRTQPTTPPTSSKGGRPANATPRTPTSASATANSPPQTPRSTRRSTQNDPSPQPGPSRRVTPTTKHKKTPAPKKSRKQSLPLKNQPPAIREMYRLQSSTHLLIPKMPFCRVVREILHEVNSTHMRVQSLALEALQEATEFYMTQFFEDAYRCTLHRKAVTLKTSDFVLVRSLRRNFN